MGTHRRPADGAHSPSRRLGALLACLAAVAAVTAPDAVARNFQQEFGRTNFYEVSAENGDPGAAWKLASRLEAGIGRRQPDAEAAAHWRQVAVERGHPPALAQRGRELLQAGKRDEALPFLQRAANKDNPEALAELAALHYVGDGVRMNRAKACRMAKRSARHGSDKGMLVHAVCLEQGAISVPQPGRAVAWLRQAAKNGHIKAMLEYAARLEAGRGTEPDLDKAVYWYTQAAAEESAPAMMRLGQLYASHEALQSRSHQATSWFRQAADYGYEPAQQRLARAGDRNPPTPAAAPDRPESPATSALDTHAAAREADAAREAEAEAREEAESFQRLLAETRIDWMAERRDWQTQRERLESELDSVTTELKTTNQQLAEARGAIDTLKNRESQLASENTELENRIAKLETRAEDLQAFKATVMAKRERERERRLAEQRARQRAIDKRLARAADINDEGLEALDSGRYVAAIRTFRKAAELGSSKAMNNLAYLYENGLGALPSEAEARKWRGRAAEAKRTAGETPSLGESQASVAAADTKSQDAPGGTGAEQVN